MRHFYVCLLAVVVMSSGCATLFTASNQVVSFSSEPPGAKLYIDGTYRGETPMSLNMGRQLSDYTVRLSKEGYKDNSATLHRKFNLIAILNLTSIPCWAVDLISGAVVSIDATQSFILEKNHLSSSNNLSSYDAYSLATE